MTAVFYNSDHPIHCPGCDTQTTEHLKYTPENRPKPEQAAWVCWLCGCVGVYCERLGRLALRIPDNAELVKLFDAHPDLMAAAMRAKARLSE